MGNTKFRLTNMISNIWSHKTKNMNKTSKNNNSIINSYILKTHPVSPAPAPAPAPTPTQTPPSSPPPPLEPQCQSRKSYHITRELNLDMHKSSSPRKSKSKSRKCSVTTSVSSSSCKSMSTTKSSSSNKSPVSTDETDVVNSDNISLPVEDDLVKIDNNKQIILDYNSNNNALAKQSTQEHYYFNLPPIITKPKKLEKQKRHISKEPRRISVSSPGRMKLVRVNSPKMTRHGQNGHKIVARKSLSMSLSPSLKKKKTNTRLTESFAVVKTSIDAERDFKDSMVEMIVENNLSDTKDLEDLLACYLTLNSDEYHHLIIKVFKQIWFDFRRSH